MQANNKSQAIKADLPLIPFASAALWEEWLERNHAESKGIWMQIFKKNSGIASVNYPLALDVALCYGWIDGQVKSIDGLSYMQRFTPRRPRSIWSKRNIEHIARLTNEGRIKPSGTKEAEAAKADGRWDAAYDGPATMSLPTDFLEALSNNKKALAFHESLNKTNKYAIAWRIQTAKRPETREKRMKDILEMLEREEKFHI